MIWHIFCLFQVYLILLQVWSNQYWTLNLYIISYIWTRMAIIWHISLLNSGISDLITSMIKSVLSIETLHYIIYCCNIKYIKCSWFIQSNVLYDFNICTNMANMLSPKTSNVFDLFRAMSYMILIFAQTWETCSAISITFSVGGRGRLGGQQEHMECHKFAGDTIYQCSIYCDKYKKNKPLIF